MVLVLLSPVQIPAYLGMAAGLGRGPRVVALCHNVLPHERKPYDVPLTRRLLRRVDAALVHSAQQAQLARDLRRAPPWHRGPARAPADGRRRTRRRPRRESRRPHGTTCCSSA